MPTAQQAITIVIDHTIRIIEGRKAKFILSPCALRNVQYAVTECGRVWSQYTTKTGKVTTKWLKAWRNTKGYLQVAIGNSKVQVSRLTAEAWVRGKTEEKNEIDHLNAVKIDCSRANLEWVDHATNALRMCARRYAHA